MSEFGYGRTTSMERTRWRWPFARVNATAPADTVAAAATRAAALGSVTPDSPAGAASHSAEPPSGKPRQARTRRRSSAFGFASLGMAITSYMKTFQHMDWITLIMLPMFLFSATFFPITQYPEPIQFVVQVFPLWHGVELIRGLTTGSLSLALLWHVLYYVVMIAVGLFFTTKRLRALFLD